MIGALLNTRKRKDRWWRFHVLREAFVHAQMSDMEGKPLDRAFRRLGYGRVPDGLLSFWQALVGMGADRQATLSREHLARLERQAAGLQPELLPPAGWLDLSRLCIAIGLFQPARVLREAGLGRMLMDVGHRSATLEQLTACCYASLERDDYESSMRFLNRMELAGCQDKWLLQAAWFVKLLSGERIREVSGPGRFRTREDEEFGRFVRDQQIAVVGPVASNVVQGEEIDRHDVIVKFGYRGGSGGREPETQGRRLDISYYNNTQAEQLAKSAYDKVLSEIRWGVCNNRKGRCHFPADYPGLRQVASLQWLMTDTHLNAGPNAILDLLRFGPGNIKVFNTDMMLSSGRFAGYKPEGDKPIDYTRSFIKTHDPILQYQIMRRLWSVGYIEGDVRFESVMKMGVREYLEELQKAYGADTRALI
jgi:hypothetical protein